MSAEPDPPRRTFRDLLPRSALGLAALLTLAGVSSAFTGAILYAYYESKQEETNSRVESFVGGFTEELDAARKLVKDEGDRALAEVQAQLDELQRFAATGGTLDELLRQVEPSVFFVSTLDENGAPSVGTAFVVFADDEQSFLLTSYVTIRAATQQPGPGVTIRKGDDTIDATVFTWDEGRDLALLTIDRPRVPALTWAAADSPPATGDRLFAVSGLGGNGAAIVQGFTADVTADGVQHDTPIGPQFQGGPLVNARGEVVAVASRTFSPVGFAPDTVWFAPLVRASCESVLQCPADGAQPG